MNTRRVLQHGKYLPIRICGPEGFFSGYRSQWLGETGDRILLGKKARWVAQKNKKKGTIKVRNSELDEWDKSVKERKTNIIMQ